MASRSVNKATLIGNLTRDPELKYTPQGTAVCSFGLATNRTWATATGQVKEDVQFHRIVAWQKLAELCQKLLSKGRKIYLEGRIVYRTFVGNDSVQRTMTEIVMEDFVIFDDRRRVGEADMAVETPTTSATASDFGTDTDTASVANEKETKKTTREKVTEKKTKTETNDETENINPEDIPF